MIEDTSRQIEGIHPSPNPLEPPREQPRQGRGGLRTGAIIGLILVLIVVFVVGGFAGWVYAGTKSSSSSSTTNATTLDALRESVAAKVRPSIVEVYVTLTNGAALGSGVIVNSQGYIVTNNHVVSGATTIQVILSNGTKEPAQLAGADAAYDLAVLKIAVPQGGLTVATLGDSTQLKVVFFSSRRRHPMFDCDWSSDVCSSDLSCRCSSLSGLDRRDRRLEPRKRGAATGAHQPQPGRPDRRPCVRLQARAGGGRRDAANARPATQHGRGLRDHRARDAAPPGAAHQGDLQRRPRGDRVDLLAGRRHRHHEHHARLGAGAHPGDRCAPGGWGHRARHPAAIPQ